MGSRYSRGGPASRELLRGGCIWIRAPHVSRKIECVVEVVIDLRNVRRGHQDPRPPIQPSATGRFSVIGPSSRRRRRGARITGLPDPPCAAAGSASRGGFPTAVAAGPGPGQVVNNRLLWRGQPVVPDFHNHGALSLSDNRRLQAPVFHFIKGSIQSLANILVRGGRKLMNQSDEHSVSRELGLRMFRVVT
jgi:hypothetical protein